MNKTTVKLKLITPCISSGANQKDAEIRAQSLRGMLHFWFRAMGGQLEEEKSIFGCIGKQDEIRRSSLNVRVIVPDDVRKSVKDCKDITGSDFDYFLWPMRSQPHTPDSGKRGIIEAGQEFDLLLSHSRIKDGRILPDEILKVAMLLGSLGTRSRRCYGSIWPVSVEIGSVTWSVPTNIEEYKSILQELLKDKNIRVSLWGSTNTWNDAVVVAIKQLKQMRCGSPKSGKPSKWGRNDHDLPIKNVNGGIVYRQALGLPLQQRYSSGDVYKSSVSGNDRWASPLHLKVIQFEDRFHLIAVFLNDYVLPENETIQIKSRHQKMTSKLSLDLWNNLQQHGQILVG